MDTDMEFSVQKHPTTEYPTMYTFKTNGYDQEINFIELINQVADTITNAIGMSNEELRRVRAYGIRRFKDIDKMEY